MVETSPAVSNWAIIWATFASAVGETKLALSAIVSGALYCSRGSARMRRCRGASRTRTGAEAVDSNNVGFPPVFNCPLGGAAVATLDPSSLLLFAALSPRYAYSCLVAEVCSSALGPLHIRLGLLTAGVYNVMPRLRAARRSDAVCRDDCEVFQCACPWFAIQNKHSQKNLDVNDDRGNNSPRSSGSGTPRW